MPLQISRRGLLAAGITDSLAALTGWSFGTGSDEGLSQTSNKHHSRISGQVWRKEVYVEVESSNYAIANEVVQFHFDQNRGEVFGSFSPSYTPRLTEGNLITISSQIHDTLQTVFDTIQYQVAIGPVSPANEHAYLSVSRTAFNKLHLAGIAVIKQSRNQPANRSSERDYQLEQSTQPNPRTVPTHIGYIHLMQKS